MKRDDETREQFAERCVVQYAWIAQRAARTLAPSRCAPDTEEDETQDALLGLWKAALSYEPAKGKLEPHLAAKAAYAVIDARRLRHGRDGQKNPRCVSLSHKIADSGEGRSLDLSVSLGQIDDAPRLVDVRDEMERRLRSMPKKLATAMRLYHLEGLTVARVGERMGLSESRVSQIMSSHEPVAP